MDTIVWKAQILVLLTLCVFLVRCEQLPLSNQYGMPGNFVGTTLQENQYQQQQTVTNSYGAPLSDGHSHTEHQDYIDSQPKSYEFGYAVRDAASGNDFGRRETSDGDTVRGEYRVQLPDGRTQIVTYTADWRTGFHANVKYEGVAQFSDQYNKGNQGYNNNDNNVQNSGFEYDNNNIESAYTNAAGNNGGVNNYHNADNSYNSGPSYNYQYRLNSVNSGYSGGSSFRPSVSPPLPLSQTTYGIPFH